jgi:hypothetical protein
VTLETQLAAERFRGILSLTGEAANAIHGEMVLAVKSRTERLALAMSVGVGGVPSERSGIKAGGGSGDVDMLDS